MLLEYAISARQAWERAKVGLQSVEDECLVDLAELSREPLEVEMASMDNGRRLKNHGEEVRFLRGIDAGWCSPAMFPGRGFGLRGDGSSRARRKSAWPNT